MKKHSFNLLLALLALTTFVPAAVFANDTDFTDEASVSEEDFIKSFDATKKAMEDKPTLLDDFNDFDMVTLPFSTNSKRVSYTIGDGTQTFTAKRIITSYKINRFETTYRLWYSIKEQAKDLGYFFQNPGQEGAAGRRGKAPTQTNQYQPVTMINWYDAIIWCNALSEIHGKTPCYTYKGEVLRDSSDAVYCDLADCNFEADGYRLPTESEWEFAARYTAKGMQKSNLASGQIPTGTDRHIPSIEEVAWFSENTDKTRIVGTAGTLFDEKAVPSPASGNANGAGLFDMSGNVLEFCWDWEANYEEESSGIRYTGPSYGTGRVSRGGSWSPFTPYIYCGDRYSYDPNEAYNYMGFRFVQTVK